MTNVNVISTGSKQKPVIAAEAQLAQFRDVAVRLQGNAKARGYELVFDIERPGIKRFRLTLGQVIEAVGAVAAAVEMFDADYADLGAPLREWGGALSFLEGISCSTARP
jgi:hypothetical protein